LLFSFSKRFALDLGLKPSDPIIGDMDEEAKNVDHYQEQRLSNSEWVAEKVLRQKGKEKRARELKKGEIEI